MTRARATLERAKKPVVATTRSVQRRARAGPAESLPNDVSWRLLAEIAESVAMRDGGRLARLFTARGTYSDCFYGVARGRRAIERLINEDFHATAEGFMWTFHEPVRTATRLYARYAFSYRSTVATAPDRRVGFEGVAILTLRGEQIEAYREIANTGPMLASLGYGPERLQRILLREDTRVWSHPDFERHRRSGLARGSAARG